MQVDELIRDRKTTFCKEDRSGNWRASFGRHSVINKLKKNNEANKLGTETAAASTLLPWDAYLFSPRSSTIITHLSNGNTKQFEKICFVSNYIRPYDSTAYNNGELGVCEKCRRLVDGCWKCNWKNKYSQFTYRKPEDRDVIKQKKLLGGIEQFHEKNFRSNVYLLNQLLHDWFFIIQHYTHDFTWTIMSRTMSLEMHSLILPVLLTKCEIGKWLRCLTNL